MRICKCDNCRYTFRYPLIPSNCPDCGSSAVRTANEKEVEIFEQDQKTLQEEIRMGLYAAAG